MSFGCLTPDSRSKYSSPNLIKANVLEEDKESASRTSLRPTRRNATSTSTHGRPLPWTAQTEEVSVARISAFRNSMPTTGKGKECTQSLRIGLINHLLTHRPLVGLQSYLISRDCRRRPLLHITRLKHCWNYCWVLQRVLSLLIHSCASVIYPKTDWASNALYYWYQMNSEQWSLDWSLKDEH